MLKFSLIFESKEKEENYVNITYNIDTSKAKDKELIAFYLFLGYFMLFAKEYGVFFNEEDFKKEIAIQLEKEDKKNETGG